MASLANPESAASIVDVQVAPCDDALHPGNEGEYRDDAVAARGCIDLLGETRSDGLREAPAIPLPNDIEFSGEKEGAPATDAESAATRC